MISYLQEAEEKDFMDLVGNPEFDQDLKNFFQGGRYNYSDEEVKDTKSLARDFVQHMRWQSMNEVTAAFDLLYIQKNDKEVSVEGQESFAKLIHAMDVTGGGGTGKLQGAWDYATAGIFSPSTGVTLATFGFGVGTKIAAKAAAKATQMSIRNLLYTFKAADDLTGVDLGGCGRIKKKKKKQKKHEMKLDVSTLRII